MMEVLTQIRLQITLPESKCSVPPILVWAFCDTPQPLRELSGHGGDEDWLAWIPKERAGEWFGWMESGSPFGCCDVSEHTLSDGSQVRIGAHA